MIKKLLLTSATLLTVTNIALGQITFDYNKVTYSMVEGSYSGEKNVQYILDKTYKDQLANPDYRNIEAPISITSIYNSVVEYYILTPLKITSGTTLDLADYSVGTNPNDTKSMPVENFSVAYLDYTEDYIVQENSEAYKEYARLCQIIKKGFANTVKKVTGGRGSSTTTIVVTDIILGSEVKSKFGVTKDTNTESYDIDDLQYYRIQTTNDKLDYVYCIDDIILNIEEGYTYRGYTQYYQTLKLPAGIIKTTTQKLVIPASLQEIENGAFKNASALNSIEATESEIYDVKDGCLYYYDIDNDEYTLVFVTPNASGSTINLADNYVAVKSDAFVKCSNVTIYSSVLASGEYGNGNKVVNTSGGPIVSAEKTKSTSFANDITYYEVTGNVSQSDLASIIKTGWNANYIDFRGATISENINIDNAISAANNGSHTANTIFIFETDKTVTGKNAVNNGICATFLLNENDAPFYTPIAFKATAATINRSVGGNWSTICLPFSIKNDATFAGAFKFGTLDSYESANNVFNFAINDYITAYIPNIIKSRSGSSTKITTFKNVDVVQTPTNEGKTQAGDAYFVGAMKTKTLATTSSTKYYVWSSNKIVRINGGEVGTFRCYMTAPNTSGAATFRITDFDGNELENIEIEEEATGIEAISDINNNNNVYNLSGELDNANKAGIYVVNGRKMIIK